MNQGEIILYQLNESTNFKIEVRLEDDTVWLTQNQMVELFNSTKQNISLHINNIFKEGELTEISTVKEFLTVKIEGKRNVKRKILLYNLDVIISVGYRVKSQRGTQFRIWANKIIKDFLLKGYAINNRVNRLEDKLIEHDKKFELLLNTNLPKTEGVFFDGQIFDAYEKVSLFIKEAKLSIILIDNYIDETVLILLTKHKKGVKITIYTKTITKQIKLDIEKYNAQYEPIEVKIFTKSHDRFLIIDEKTIYHIGASLKDLGKKWFAFSKIDIDSELILKNLAK
jgi:hypothetical protein